MSSRRPPKATRRRTAPEHRIQAHVPPPTGRKISYEHRPDLRPRVRAADPDGRPALAMRRPARGGPGQGGLRSPSAARFARCFRALRPGGAATPVLLARSPVQLDDTNQVGLRSVVL